MEKQLKCVLLLSLKETALRRVAGLLSSGSDILAPISKFMSYKMEIQYNVSYIILCEEFREAVKEKIKDQVLKLEIPESLAKQMIDKIRPMTLELREWISNHQGFFRNLNNAISVLDSIKFYWTTAGTINYKRTAEELARCDKLDVERRYELACQYCLEDYISLYWEELPEEKKQKYCDDEHPWLDLPSCWPHILKEEYSKLDYLLRESNRNLTSFNQWAFEQSAERHRKAAAEYFFQKLTHEEREASLKRAVVLVMEGASRFDPREKRSDVLSYLLSVMTPEQQMETIKAYPVDVLLCFLHWPLHDLFLDNAVLLWTFIPPSSYKATIDKIIYEYNNLCFPTMFQEFFVGSPPDFRKCFVEEENEYGDTPAFCFLYAFFDSDDSESIKVMFRSLDAADRVKLVFHWRVLELFERYMLRCKCYLVEVCLREAALPKEEKGRLKNEFKRYLEGLGEAWKLLKLKRFFEFLDETDASSDKREKGQKRKLGNCSRDQ